MRILFIIFTLGFSATTYAENCYEINNPGYGAPDEYYLHECLGKKALKDGDYEKAIKELTAALAQNIHEAPNYELKLELGEAYCKAGKFKNGKEILKKFQCMVNAEFGKIQCTNKEKLLTDECMFLACESAASVLSAEGKLALENKYLLSEKILRTCK